jgi:transposase InsO family protein
MFKRDAFQPSGFEQPLAAHQHWHIDVSYINISGTFYYLCSILDGCSRYIVNCNLRVDDRVGDRDHLGASQGISPGSAVPDDLPTTVHMQTTSPSTNPAARSSISDPTIPRLVTSFK